MSARVGCFSMLMLVLAVPLAAIGAETKELTKINELRAELAQDPKDWNANYNLGLALMRSIEPSLRRESGLSADETKVAQEAETHFKTAISLSNRSHGRALVMLGWLYKFQHQYDQAIPVLQDALRLPPESDDYLKAADVLAVCYSAAGRNDEALAVVDEALKHHPADPDLLTKKKFLEGKKRTAPQVPADDRSKRAQKLGEDLAAQMQKIMGSAEPEAAKQQEMKTAQEQYQSAVMALYK